MIEVSKYKISSKDDLEKIKVQWKMIESGDEMTVFQSYEWNVLLFEEWNNSGVGRLFSEIYVYIAGEERNIAILPLIVQKASTKTRWSGKEKGIHILGYASYSDYLSLIYSEFDKGVTDAIIAQVKDDFKNMIIHFSDVRDGTAFSRYLSENEFVLYDTGVSVAVKIGSSAEEYKKLLSKHVKQNLRTAANRMAKDNLSYELCVMGTIQEKVLLDELLAIHIERMKTKNTSKTDIVHLMSSVLRKYIREKNEKRNNIVYKSMQVMDNSCCVIVKIGTEIAGYIYGFYDNGTARIIQNCVADKFAFYSPMFKGCYDFILSCYEKTDIKEVDFTRGDEEYKYRLGGVETKLFHYIK